MSIIERSNPLNLSYQICIVSGASSDLGTIICKTLLKANAFVDAVDTTHQHHSLNAGPAVHFGFDQCNLADPGSAEKVIESARTKHKTDRINVLVNVVEEGTETQWNGVTRLSTAVAKAMAKEGNGRVITILGNENVPRDKASSLSKAISKEHSGVTCNIVMPSEGNKNKEDQQAAQKFKKANSHMTEIMNIKEGGAKQSDAKAKLYDIGNLTLYLCGGLGDEITDSVVYLDGSYESL